MATVTINKTGAQINEALDAVATQGTKIASLETLVGNLFGTTSSNVHITRNATTKKYEIVVDGDYVELTPEQLTELQDKIADELVGKLGSVSGLQYIEDDKILITDADGYIGAEIGQNGIIDYHSVDNDDNNNNTPAKYPSHPLKGLSIYSFGDSLCGGQWEAKLAEITGAIFNQEANKLTSAGGSFTGDIGGPLYNEAGYMQNGDMPGGVRRAKNFALMDKETYGNKDVIFFENVHDGGEDIDLTEIEPFFYSQYKVFDDIEFSGANAQNDANSYFNNNFNDVISIFDEPKPNSIVHLKIATVTKQMQFLSGATSAGNVIITVNGHPISTAVLAGDTIEQVVDKINIWSFGDFVGWANKKNGTNTLNFQYTGANEGSLEDTFSFDAGNTGITISAITESTSISIRAHGFLSLDINDWEDKAKWGYVTGHTRSYSQWKGVIEHIQSNCPDTIMYMCIFPNSIYKNEYIRADGSFDVETFYKSNDWKSHEKNRLCLTKIANYYNIPIIDVEKEMNVMSNWKKYYNPNDVHYKSTLYGRIAEIIAKNTYGIKL